MLTRYVLALAALSMLLAAHPASASAQAHDDCTVAGVDGFPVAVGLFEGEPWPPLGANQVGFGYATSRPTGYVGPGSWTVNIDWGDGKSNSSPPNTTGSSGGPLPAGTTAPPVWVVHTYAAPGTYDIHITASGTLNTHSDNSGAFIPCTTDLTFPVRITRIDVLPPADGDDGGGSSGGGTARCPAAAGLLASARYWNEVAQRHRGLSVKAHQAVIDYWGKASAAFYAVLGIAATDLPGDLISKGTAKHLARKDTIDGYRQLWQNSLNGKWPEISRQLRVLTELQKFLKALGPIGKLDATLHAGESLYWLGLAAQQGVIRDRMDAIADAALKNATDDQRRAARACGKGGAAASAASAGRTPPYAKLARPRAVKRLRLDVGGRKARALNKLLAGQERATALADVVGESAARALAAEKAGKKTWRDRQLRHARKTARKLASHLDAQARRRGQVAAALGGAPRTVEITEPAKLGKLLRKIGLPDVVKRLGFRPQALRRIFTKPPAGQLTLPSLADPAAAERDRAWAAALRALAAGP